MSDNKKPQNKDGATVKEIRIIYNGDKEDTVLTTALHTSIIQMSGFNERHEPELEGVRKVPNGEHILLLVSSTNETTAKELSNMASGLGGQMINNI